MCTPHFVLGNLIVIETIAGKSLAVEEELPTQLCGRPASDFYVQTGTLGFTNLLLVLRLGPFPNIIAFFFFATNKTMFRANIHALKNSIVHWSPVNRSIFLQNRCCVLGLIWMRLSLWGSV